METPTVSLAWQALASPYIYLPSYEVLVQLDEPLWTPTSGPETVAMDIMGLCVQLEAVLLQSKEKVMSTGNRRVWFEGGGNYQSRAILGLMRDTLCKAGETEDVESYLRESGIGYLFPRVELYLQEPDQELTRVQSGVMDGYWTHLSNLHNVSTLAHQMHTDLTLSASHKYIAHTAALLYQALSGLPQAAAPFKGEMEARFSDLKSASVPNANGHPPRLPHHLHTWLLDYSARLKQLTADPLSHHSSQLTPVLNIAQS